MSVGGGGLEAGLERAIERLCARRRVLVAVDFDGTVAELTGRPGDAVGEEGVMRALRNLSEMEGVTTAVVSGRAAADLAERVGDTRGLLLVGSHGGEVLGEERVISETERAALREVVSAVREAAAGVEGAVVEVKPAGAAFHWRMAEAGAGERAAEELRGRLRGRKGVFMREGKMVVEFSVIEASKGAAIEMLRQRVGAEGVLYAGDDLTDEEVFAILREGDVGVKVGEGTTRAGYRVENVAAIGAVLRAVVRGRGGER